MAHIVCYFAHDPVGNVSGQVVEFNQVKLIDAEKNGIIFYAAYDDGTRKQVKAAEVSEPKSLIREVRTVEPLYVDTRMRAVIDVFDALDKKGSLLQASSDFHTALLALKKLVFGGEKK